MVYVAGALVQPFTVVVTLTVPLITVDPALVAVKDEILPLPLAPKPIPVLELVQAKLPPAGVLLKVVAAILVPLHTVVLDGTLKVGTGFTVMV